VTDTPSNLRSLPSVDRLLAHPHVASAGDVGRQLLADAAREVIDHARERVRAGEPAPKTDELAERVVAVARSYKKVRLSYAINATGVVLHTGLGRARLCPSAQRAVEDAARGHSLLEIDQETGKRGSRVAAVGALLTRLTGAESAHVCNNNAAAVMLCVNAFACGKEAIISRGQCVEIGGSFRMTDVIAAAGAKLVEVGTTNRTRLSDYERAIGPNTGCIVRCHPSNFRVTGFTEEVSPADLAALSARRGVQLIDDVGSGCLVDTETFGLAHEPTLAESVAAGAGLVTASGDKLLGGPQAGVILGRRELVQRVARNPMARAVRCDKLTLAALEATLREYLDPPAALARIPTLVYLGRSHATLDEMARCLAGLMEDIDTSIVDGVSEVGGGSLPGAELPTRLVRIECGTPPDEIARRLRVGSPPVFARIVDDRVCLDPRTLDEDEMDAVASAARAALA
jgi:L-seryl-tRNA(Ser) seleniumtransferase